MSKIQPQVQEKMPRIVGLRMKKFLDEKFLNFNNPIGSEMHLS